MATYQSPFGPWLVGVHFFGVDSNWRFPFFSIASCEQLPNYLAEFHIKERSYFSFIRDFTLLAGLCGSLGCNQQSQLGLLLPLFFRPLVVKSSASASLLSQILRIEPFLYEF